MARTLPPQPLQHFRIQTHAHRHLPPQLLIAHVGAHNAYHIGQILYVRKLQGVWDPAKGVEISLRPPSQPRKLPKKKPRVCGAFSLTCQLANLPTRQLASSTR